MNILTECPNCNTDIYYDDVSNNDFDAAILSLLGKSHLLTKEDEETINRIADKFKYN